MRVIECASQDRAAELVAEEIVRSVQRKPDLVLGLATGSTPIGVYQRLVRAHRTHGISFAGVRTFNLDEYLGLAADHPQSYRSFMRAHLFAELDIPPGSIRFPPVEGSDLLGQCAAFEAAIDSAGGIDIQLLGIGRNGHIGFNEPTSSLASRTRVTTLADKTLADNARFYRDGETQPHMATTMGVGTILGARRILLQSFGAAKAEAVRAAVEGPVTAFVPASALQLHPDVTFYLDAESASRLTLRAYYRRMQDDERSLGL